MVWASVASMSLPDYPLSSTNGCFGLAEGSALNVLREEPGPFTCTSIQSIGGPTAMASILLFTACICSFFPHAEHVHFCMRIRHEPNFLDKIGDAYEVLFDPSGAFVQREYHVVETYSYSHVCIVV